MALLTKEEVPSAYQEKMILTAYRSPGLTFMQSIKSLFQWHNETFNFWTHFIVFGYFFWKFQSLNLPFVENAHYWPLLCVRIGSCMYPLMSSLAHAFCSMDINTRHMVFYLDYMGISMFSSASSIGFLAYSSPDDIFDLTTYFFAYTSALLAVMSCLACCQSRHIGSHFGNVFRLAAFSLPYLFSTSFILYWLFYHDSSPIHYHYPHIFWNPMIALVNVCKLPERYVPFHFDVVGHSHQIFHIVAFIATNHQVDALIQDCLLKKGSISNIEFVSWLSVKMMIVVFIADTIIVVYHAIKLHWPKMFMKKEN